MGRKTLYLVAAFLISGCSYSVEAGAFDGPYGGPYGGNYVAGPSYYQPVAYMDSGQPILAQPLYIDGVPVSFQAIDYGVYELVDPDGYVIGYAYVDGVDRLRITDLEGNTLYFLNYDSGGYFRAFNPYGAYLAYFAPSYLVHHFHINRHHFNTPFFHSGSKARKRFRGRASKHRKARLRQRGHHDGRRFSSRGHHDHEFEGRRDGKRKDHHDGKKKRHSMGSGWKPVHHPGQAPRQFDASPRGRNTGGAVFENDFPIQPQAEPQRNPRAKGERRKAKRRATGGQQRRQRPAATQAAQAPQPQRQAPRAVSTPPPSPPPQAVQATKSSAPKSQPSRPKVHAQRSRPPSHRSGPRNSNRRR